METNALAHANKARARINNDCILNEVDVMLCDDANGIEVACQSIERPVSEDSDSLKIKLDTILWERLSN